MNNSKYHNKRTWVGTISFPSQKEAYRFGELKLLERAGEITGLKLQVTFVLYAGIKYIADFIYYEKKDPEKLVVEDCKGFKTDVYKLKKRMLLDKYDSIRFIET